MRIPWLPARADRQPMPRGLRAALPAVALAGWAVLAWRSHQPPGGLVWWLLGILAVQWVLALVVTLRTVAGSGVKWLAWGIAFRAVGLVALPVLEDDPYRYLWDGRTFALTGNPYATAPSEHFSDPEVPPDFAEILDRVNHPDVPTIYGPATEGGFLLAYLVAPAALWPWKLLLLAADVALLLALLRLGQGKTGVRAATFAAWCPLSVFETAFNAHPDALAVALAAWAMVAASRNRNVATGICCGLAVATKVFALLIIPFLLWRRRWTAWVACATVLAGCYLPFWLQGSLADLAGLGAFAAGWEFNSSGYALLAWMFGPSPARVVSTFLFGAAWLVLWRWWAGPRADANRILPGLAVFGIFFLLTPTFNPWYALWMLPFVALHPTATGVAFLSAVSLSYLTRQNLGEGVLDGFAHPSWVRPLEFGLIGLAIALDSIRWRAARLKFQRS